MELNDWLKILFVEDSAEVLANYTRYFQRYYKYFENASDGLEAYKKYRTFEPDVIFLDIKIPKMDGIEVLKRIRKKDQTIKIVMLTAYSEDVFVNKALSLGADHFLAKPIELYDLRDMLQIVEKQIGLQEAI